MSIKNITTTVLGNKFEMHALDYLIKHGANLICKQYKSKYGEIDLIVSIDTTIIFVEVRARKSNLYGGALYSITKTKQNKIIQTAEIFIQEYNSLLAQKLAKFNYRFDVIVFENGRIEWIKNCIES